MAGGRLDNFHPRPFLREGRGKPGLGLGIPMDEEDLGGLGRLANPANQLLAGDMGGKIEIPDLALDRQRPGRIPPFDLAILSRGAKTAGRGKGFGVAHKKDGVVFPGKKETGDRVAGGVGGHHA